jgi:hypothetical protein
MPTPSALAASFDEDACYETGELIARECRYHGTNVLLAPGINIKRYVMCGRNFEYFSEDPYLTGVLAAGYVNGLEDNGVGACVKHYACNSQEHGRMANSSEVSLRALNEIYLRGFGYVLKYSSPASIMTSYNKVNGKYAAANPDLIEGICKTEWGFSGLVMTDWCVWADVVDCIKAGTDTDMPGRYIPPDKCNDDNRAIFQKSVLSLITLLSKALTILVCIFSLGLIEPTKIVLHPRSFPARISVNGLSPIITALLGVTLIEFKYSFIILGLGLFALPITLQGAN